MFGYATDETEECMPLTIVLAHKLNAKMAELRRTGNIPWLRPDSKTQVSLCISTQTETTPQQSFYELVYCFHFECLPRDLFWCQQTESDQQWLLQVLKIKLSV